MAPVGSYESLAAAIQARPDALYFAVCNLPLPAACPPNFPLHARAHIV